MKDASPRGGHGADRGRSCSTDPDHRFDLAVAVDLVMIQRGLTSDEAHELIRARAAESGTDLDSVVSDVIDLGIADLPR